MILEGEQVLPPLQMVRKTPVALPVMGETWKRHRWLEGGERKRTGLVEETLVEEESGESGENEERSFRRVLKFDSDSCADSPFLGNRPFALDSSQEETIAIWTVFYNKYYNRKQKEQRKLLLGCAFTGKVPKCESFRRILHPTTWDSRRDSGRKVPEHIPLTPIPRFSLSIRP